MVSKIASKADTKKDSTKKERGAAPSSSPPLSALPPDVKKLTKTKPSSFPSFIWLIVPIVIAISVYLHAPSRSTTSSASFNPRVSSINETGFDPQSPLLVDLPRRNAIYAAFKRSYNGYERDAFGMDNYHPIGMHGHNHSPAGPIGYFVVDVLDSLILMGLDDEFKRAREWVKELSFDLDDKFHTFEITIRVLGGLLSAYHMSNNDPIFLEKAIELGDRLLPAFDTPSGIPASFINLSQRKGILDADNYNFSSAAEAGTLQLEFKYLAELTGDLKYWNPAERVMDVIRAQVRDEGLVPIMLSTETGQFIPSEIRLGSRGDSYYEYLLKQYIQTNRTEPVYREMYDKAMTGIKLYLVKTSLTQEFVITSELIPQQARGRISFVNRPKQDHLVCFLGGSLLLGAGEGQSACHGDPLIDPAIAREDHIVGVGLIESCMETYNTKTGLGPEISYWFSKGQEHVVQRYGRDWYVKNEADAKSMLRPELVESLFLAYRTTRNPLYREWGWRIFQAIDKHTKVSTGGYASITNVDKLPVEFDDNMETFFLAETLKYLYLLFSEEELIPLNQFVFNTEAHILPIFSPSLLRSG